MDGRRFGWHGPLADPFLWLDPLNWPGFAGLVAKLFCDGGYSAARVRGGRPEQGSVLAFCKDGHKILVQCQPWDETHADAQSARELYGIQLAEQAGRAVLITSGVFSAEAIRFAAGKPLLLVDGASCLDLAPQLHKLMLERQSFPHAAPARALFPPTAGLAARAGERPRAVSDRFRRE